MLKFNIIALKGGQHACQCCVLPFCHTSQWQINCKFIRQYSYYKAEKVVREKFMDINLTVKIAKSSSLIP